MTSFRNRFEFDSPRMRAAAISIVGVAAFSKGITGARPGAFLRIDRRREYSHIIRLLQLPRISAFSPRHSRVRGKSMRAWSGGTPSRVRAISLARSLTHPPTHPPTHSLSRTPRFLFLMLRVTSIAAIIAADATYVR